MTRHKTRHRGIYYRLDSKDRRRYIVWFTDSAGKAHTETLPLGSTEQDALDRQAELRGKKSRGERVAPTRMRFAELADEWLERQKGRLADETISKYHWALETHLKPRFGRRKLSDITVDDVARLIEDMKKAGKKAWTIRGALTPLSRVMAHAVRRGFISANPVLGLERDERPKSDQAKMRILSSEEIEKLLAAAPDRYRPLLTAAVFTGLRKGELLRLRWEDVDFDAGVLTVRESKTEAGAGREVVLMPALAASLRRHKLASRFSQPQDPVFCSEVGTPLHERNVNRRALEAALTKAGLEHVRFHDLRHTFASILIGQGMDVTFVADQMGHADPAITLRVYAKLFDPTRRKDEAREKLEAAFGGLL